MLNLFNLPKQCEIDRVIPKTTFFNNSDITTHDKKILSSLVDKAKWQYSLKASTYNLLPYIDETKSYEEIEIISVKIKEDSHSDKLADIVLKSIPYPMILILEFNDRFKLYVAHRRINLSDTSKDVLAEVYSTEWLTVDDELTTQLDIAELNLTNCYSLYSDIVDIVCQHNYKKIVGEKNKVSADEARKLTAAYQSLNAEIDSLKIQIKKETQFNIKVELNMKINQLKKRSEQISMKTLV